MEHITYVLELKVMVCRDCACAVLPGSIEAHFKPTRPHGFTKAERRRIMDAATRMEGLAWDEKAMRGGGF
jgi:hypothetical protein